MVLAAYVVNDFVFDLLVLVERYPDADTLLDAVIIPDEFTEMLGEDNVPVEILFVACEA
jgi:hypothetical protein